MPLIFGELRDGVAGDVVGIRSRNALEPLGGASGRSWSASGRKVARGRLRADPGWRWSCGRSRRIWFQPRWNPGGRSRRNGAIAIEPRRQQQPTARSFSTLESVQRGEMIASDYAASAPAPQGAARTWFLVRLACQDRPARLAAVVARNYLHRHRSRRDRDDIAGQRTRSGLPAQLYPLAMRSIGRASLSGTTSGWRGMI